MPTVALQVTVTDYAKWRPIFDRYRSHRAEAGFKNERVFRNVDDPNEIIIWGEAISGSKLRRALARDERGGWRGGNLKAACYPLQLRCYCIKSDPQRAFIHRLYRSGAYSEKLARRRTRIVRIRRGV